MPPFGVYARGIRFPFLSLIFVFVPVSLAVSFYNGSFHLINGLLTWVGLLSLHASANTFNDYFDYRSGLDLITQPTPFSGGSGVLPKKEMNPKSMLIMALGFLTIGSIIGIYFTLLFGAIILGLLIISALSIFLYSLILAKVGIGELVVGLNFGPLLSIGVYYVQTQSITTESILVGSVLGILTASILYINEFPDHDADKAKGRYHLVVRMGKEKAVYGYIVLMILIYTLIILGIVLSITPPLSIIALLSMPLAIKASRILKKNYNAIMELIPGMASTIMCTLSTGILLFIAYIIHILLLVI